MPKRSNKLRLKKMKPKKKTKYYEWQQKALQGGVCSTCNRRFDVLTVDHIIPQSIVQVIDPEAVYEDEENFMLVCAACNRFKAGRIDIKNPKTKELLIKYANRI